MRRTTSDYEAATFIIRLWRERRDVSATDSGWRGTAVHVQSGTERGIQELEDLITFMQTWLESSSPRGDE